ncbi:phytase [Roseateles oligotrophus]|uniref:Phytase n=1 Tax=Roseateles oligotrophus TaxID=1769250 RepID=A0ABT2YD33_9BURK|nr:phytase [Roseateles oligotrophus]MCV2367947.1 phytase [Roseateles oligotrophus]
MRANFLLALLGLSLLLGQPAVAATSLKLDKAGLHLLDENGRELDSLKLRAKRWDQRVEGSHETVAVLLDADRGRPVLVRSEGRILLARDLPEPTFAVDALCLHRDPQGLLHLFLLGEEGLSEQWLITDKGARTLRRLATAPSPEGCRVDDRRQVLQVHEAGLGLWEHGTEAEGKPQRRLVKVPSKGKAEPAPKRYDWPVLQATAQTDPVERLGDAADDPAIWLHPLDASRSRVLGTNKKQGLLTYDLSGREQQLLEVGRINNVDLRQRIQAGGKTWDLAVATQRDENSLLLFGIDAEGRVSELARLPTDLTDIYGLCVGRTPDGQLDVFPNDKDGRVQQYRVELNPQGQWQARLLRAFKLSSQPEGCVVHEAEQRLFVGEEKRGIWAVDARAEVPAKPQLVMPVGAELQPDVEGLALYQGKPGAPSYLLVSSQGNHSYLVLDAKPPFALRGGFRIGINAQLGIDGTSETDGLDVSSADFGGLYGQGLIVVQDGHKRLPDGPQNFKYLPWSEVTKALKLR